MEQTNFDNGDQLEYSGPAQYTYYGAEKRKSKLDFMSKLFSAKKKSKSTKRMRSPQMKRVQQMRRLSPERLWEEEELYVVTESERDYVANVKQKQEIAGNDSPYNMIYFEEPLEKNATKSCDQGDWQDRCEKEDILKDLRHNKTYIELVRVRDWGTNPYDVPPEPKDVQDKGTDPLHLEYCGVSSCEKEKEIFKNKIKEKETINKACLEEGGLLVEDIEKIKKHLSNIERLPDIFYSYIKLPKGTPTEFLRLSRTCLMEFSKHFQSTHKQLNIEIQKIKDELDAVKKEKVEKEAKIKSIERKLEAQSTKFRQDGKESLELQLTIEKLQESLDTGKKVLRDTEKSLKAKIEKLESDLATQKHSNEKLRNLVEEKIQEIKQQEIKIEKLEISVENSKQQAKDIQYNYKSKIAKIDLEHSNKIAAICENQTKINKQLSQALDQSNTYGNQLQEAKKENALLVSANKAMQEKMLMLEKGQIKAQERCSAAERKLSRETQEVLALRSQVEQLEVMKEEELLTIDGDVWCQIMYQQDQNILDDLKESLQKKETHLEVLRSQGDCALRDFEKVQNELQQRRQQFIELKDVLLDFEKKRDIVVREQRDFYHKLLMLCKKTIPRDRFYKTLIEENQLKTYKITELENSLKNTETIIEESKKVADAQLRAMQAEMKFTAEKLYEFENQIRMKDMHLQEVIRVFEQEKKNKISAQEAMNTYKILLEDTKKDNMELRNKLNYLEDLEKNRTNASRVNEELAKETQRRHDTEFKLQNLEKDFLEIKSQLQTKEEKSTVELSETATSSSRECEQLRKRVLDLDEDKRYLERILKESQRSKELLQKDHEDLYKKMRHAVRVMVESKETQETMEMKLDQRLHCIQQLQNSQLHTEEQLDMLRDVVHEMKQAISSLNQERDELYEKLTNHMHCKAERAVTQELKLLQRDKAISEEQHIQEKEMLLQRIRDNESMMKEQHKHLQIFQEQLDNLNNQLRDMKGQLVTERHNHTQQLLSVQAEKTKFEMYIQELESKLSKLYESRLRQQQNITTTNTMGSSARYYSTDSYDPPIRDHNKHHIHRK